MNWGESGLPPDFWETLPLGRGVRLVARDDNGVAAFAKPAGVLSHPNAPKDESRALLACPYDASRECFTWPDGSGGTRRLWLLNRLDSAASGVILAAADEGATRAVKARFAQKRVRKVYRAVVFGLPSGPPRVWRDRLAVEKRGGRIRASTAGALVAETRFSVLRRRAGDPPLALVQLEPRTGRSHQLRVQCAKHGLPIVGDQTYGDFRLNREFARQTGLKRLCLHSLETRFEYELAGRVHTFAAEAPPPPEFATAMKMP